MQIRINTGWYKILNYVLFYMAIDQVHILADLPPLIDWPVTINKPIKTRNKTGQKFPGP